MSRRLFAFLLSELKTLRIVCRGCAAATELTLKQAAHHARYDCPGCGKTMAGRALLQQLAEKAAALQALAETEFAVEFVLPDQGA